MPPLIYPHNIVLTFWSELGLLGLFAFGWVFTLGLIQSSRGWRELKGWPRAVSLGVGLALITMFIHGMLDVPYWKNDLSLEFWALLGLQWVAQHLASAPAEPDHSVRALA